MQMLQHWLALDCTQNLLEAVDDDEIVGTALKLA